MKSASTPPQVITSRLATVTPRKSWHASARASASALTGSGRTGLRAHGGSGPRAGCCDPRRRVCARRRRVEGAWRTDDDGGAVRDEVLAAQRERESVRLSRAARA
eukprot:3544533-Prymnesium_polylepis.1